MDTGARGVAETLATRTNVVRVPCWRRRCRREHPEVDDVVVVAERVEFDVRYGHASRRSYQDTVDPNARLSTTTNTPASTHPITHTATARPVLVKSSA